MRTVLLLMLSCLLCAGVASSAPGGVAERLRQVVSAERDRVQAQAVLFGMWVGDREVLTTALGHSMTSVPARTDMHYRIGGITETFQATLLARLAEEGRLDLDAPISRWVPDLLEADRVTPRMLVANTAGYPDYVLDADFVDLITREPFRELTADELIAWAVKKGRMDYPPGTSQRYSHTDYVILARVMELATGQGMAELYRQYILEPYGLEDTQFPSDQEIQPPVLHAFLADRGVYEDSTYYNPSWAGATGGLTSNLRDLGRWGHLFGTGALVSPASFREMTATTSVGKGRNRPDLYFAWGFVVANGWYVQNPNMNGYSGGFAYHPPTGTTLVVAATRSPKTTVVSPAFEILRKAVATVTPDSPLNF